MTRAVVSWWGAVALGALLGGCVQDADGGEAADAEVVDRGRLLTDLGPDAGGAGGAGGAAGAGGMAGAGGAGGAGGAAGMGGMGGAAGAGGAPPDQGPPDQGPVRAIETCEDACGRYAECDQLVSSFGDFEACRARCERVSRGGPPAAWFACVEAEACNLLRLCPVPRVDPLSCDEACERVEACAVDVALPDCAAACASQEAGFVACAESLFGRCDPEAFRGCLARDLLPECAAECAAVAACNLADRGACEASCVSRLLGDDPLTRLRQAQRRACIAGAGPDCLALTACVDPPPYDPRSLNQFEFCALYAECELGQQIPCAQLFTQLRAGGVACAAASMRRGCPFSEQSLLDECRGQAQVNPRLSGCSRYCEARDVCGVLEGNRPECVNGCSGNQAADPDAARRADAELVCGDANSCPDLDACLARVGPGGECGALCARLDGCGLGAADCLATCDAAWPRDRHAAWRACVDAAADCEAVAACAVAPGVPCDRYCEALAGCGQPASPFCPAECDDAHFADPLSLTTSVACVLSAGVCEAPAGERSVAACLRDPGAQGGGCFSYCRAVTECDPAAEESVVSCLTACVQGFGDARGLDYAAGAACFEAAAPDAACAVVRGCLPEAPPPVDCAALCAAQADCQIPAPDCAAACAAAPDRDRAGCVAEALRVGLACGGVAACVGFEPPPASPDCASLCASRRACEPGLDPYLCRLACTPEPEGLRTRRACADVAVCPELPGCLALDGAPARGCAAPCAEAVACGAFEDAADCAAICTGRDAAPRTPEGWVDQLPACLQAAACDPQASAACFDVPLCEGRDRVIVLPAAGGRVNLNTAEWPAGPRANCGGGGPQAVVAITLQRAARVVFETVDNQYDTLIHLRADCDDPASELACNDDGGQGLASRIAADLQPGTYFLFVDGFGGRGGITDLVVTVQ